MPWTAYKHSFNPKCSWREGFPGGSDGKESACNTGDPGSIPGLGRSLEGERGNPLQYSCLENPIDRGAWWATGHRAPQGRSRMKQLITAEYTQPSKRSTGTSSAQVCIMGWGGWYKTLQVCIMGWGGWYKTLQVCIMGWGRWYKTLKQGKEEGKKAEGGSGGRRGERCRPEPKFWETKHLCLTFLYATFWTTFSILAQVNTQA